MQPTRTPEDQKGLADLDAELAASAQALGEPLHWTAAEAQLRELLADTMDRRANWAAKYPRTRDTNTRIKLSAEIRQATRDHGIKTEVPQPESLTIVSPSPSGPRTMGSDGAKAESMFSQRFWFGSVC
jgi:hypothetical protein